MANTARLVIDPITRKISTKYEKIRLVQHDNNSMRITFEMPRYVRGHDMSKCSTCEVHYDNISIDRKTKNSDVYLVKDITIAPEDETTINFSWLVSRNATQIVGSVEFSLHFGCSEDPSLEYAWHTTTYSGINVFAGKHNTESTVEKFPPDALAGILGDINKLNDAIYGNGDLPEDAQNGSLAHRVSELEKNKLDESSIASTLSDNDTDKAPSVKAVNEGLAGKLDRIKNTSTTVHGIYMEKVNNGGTVLRGISSVPRADSTGGCIVTYAYPSGSDDLAGNYVLVTSTPTKGNHCTPKKYVDDGLTTVREAMPSSMQKTETYAYEVEVEQGRVSDIDGAELEDYVAVRTDFIPIGKGVSGAFESGTEYQYYSVVAYDSNKAFLGAATIDFNGKWVADYSLTTAPCNVDEIVSVYSEAKFVRFNFTDYNVSYFTPEGLRFSFTAQKVVGLNGKTMDEVLAGKLDKTTKAWQVYATGATGNQVTFGTSRGIVNNVAVYGTGDLSLANSKAYLYTPTPKYDYQCANKRYVDDLVNPILSELGSFIKVEYRDAPFGYSITFDVPDGALPHVYLSSNRFIANATNGENIPDLIAPTVSFVGEWGGLGEADITDAPCYLTMPEGTKQIRFDTEKATGMENWDGNEMYSMAQCIFQVKGGA